MGTSISSDVADFEVNMIICSGIPYATTFPVLPSAVIDDEEQYVIVVPWSMQNSEVRVRAPLTIAWTGS